MEINWPDTGDKDISTPHIATQVPNATLHLPKSLHSLEGNSRS